MKGIRKIIWAIAALLLASVGLTLWWQIDRAQRQVTLSDRPRVSISLDSLGVYFKTDAKTAILSPNEIVAVEGQIKEINTLNGRHTIVLKGAKNRSPYIICDIQEGHEKELKLLKKNDTVTIKGIYKGFLKDVIFLNCIVTHPKPK